MNDSVNPAPLNLPLPPKRPRAALEVRLADGHLAVVHDVDRVEASRFSRELGTVRAALGVV